MPHDYTRSREALEPRAASPSVPAVTSSYVIPPTQPVPDRVGLNELVAALWRGRWTIAGALAVGLTAALAITALRAPTYRARASLQLEAFNNDGFLREVAPISPTIPNAPPESYLQNGVKLLESETLAKRVAAKLDFPPPHPTLLDAIVRKLGLKDALVSLRLPLFAYLTPEQRRTRSVQDALTVRTSLQSQVIEVFYDAGDPELAARGANTVASEFVAMNREARFELAKDTTEWLDKQATGLEATLVNSNRQLQDFARSSGLVFAGAQSTLSEDRMRQLQDALAKAEADRAAKQSRYEAAAASPEALMSDASASSPLRQYQTDLQNLRRELAQLQTLYTPTNYKVERVQAQIADAERSIEKERKAILDQLRTEYGAAKGLESLLSQTYAAQMRTVQQQMDQERRYDIKKGEIDATQKLYESMLEKTKEAGAASALRATNVRIIDVAGAPPTPYSPDPWLNMALGFATGILGGGALVLVRAGSDKVKRPGESALPNIPELGVIPSARTAGALGQPGREASLITESFRTLLTSILFRRSSSKSQVLAVTSIDVMEGKTTVLVNLGMAAAEQKLRVLLIDADLRRGRLHRRLGIANTSGLVSLLKPSDSADSDRVPMDSPVRATFVPGLSILPTGPGRAAGPLYSSDLRGVIDRFRSSYDLILIDTPPMMLYADARVLGRVTDGVVLVIRANTKSRRELRTAQERLAQDGIPVLGTVLNDWKMDRDELRSYARYQKHYQSA